MAVGVAVLCARTTVSVAQSVAVAPAPSAAVATLVTVNVVDAPLDDVLKNIARQSELHPFFDDTVYTLKKRVSLHLQHVPVGEAFALVLAGTGLKAEISAGDVAFTYDAGRGRRDGGVTGTVVDAKTKVPLRGVTVTVDDAKKGVTTGTDGTFRLARLSLGAHVLHVRLLGYVKMTKSITVAEGEITTIDVGLESSVNTLEQVVVTGTVAPTELKAIPHAITVITAKELQDRGITRIDELFRGDVPGLFVQRTGSMGATGGGVQGTPGRVDVWSRGSANLGGQADGIKTYVDGVELADKNRLALIDPTAIERIEIITGPEASTIYGSNAINGVMQIFTKRGTTSRPQVTAELRSAWTQNNFNAALAPKHTTDLSAAGVDGRISYNVGGSWGYTGSWSPSVKEQTVSGFAGERVTMGPLTLDAHLRVYQDQNSTNARDDGQAALEGDGEGPTSYVGGAAPLRYRGTSVNRAGGGTVTFPLTSWWSHTVTLGLDQSLGTGRKLDPSYSAPVDSTLFFFQNTDSRFTAAYNTTVQVPVTTLAKLVLTVGLDESHTTNNLVGGDYVGAYTSTASWAYSQKQAHEHGGFLQSQLGMWDALFVTYGLRAVYNPNIGADQNPNLEPHYGVAYARDIAGITAKVRASYGTATRPPWIGAKDSVKAGRASFQRLFGTDVIRLANPNLVPESQQGGEGGFELYFGTRGSLQMTRFNHTADNLIINPIADSTRALVLGCNSWISNCHNGYYYLRQSMNLNIGSVRNQGWEGTGTVNIGVLTATGTYSWTKSRMIGITPKYRGQFPQYVVGAPFNFTPEHTYAVDLVYVHGGTRVAYNLQGQGAWGVDDYDFFYRTGQGNTRAQIYQSRMEIPSPFTNVRPGYYLGDLNVSQQFTPHVEGLVQINNVHNSYQNEINPLVAYPGRTTGLGLRMRF